MKTAVFSLLCGFASQCCVLAEDKPEAPSDDFFIKLQPYVENNHFTSKEWFNWGGSIIKEAEGSYYLFYSRWPRKHGFLSWLTHSEIAVAHSTHASGPWNYRYTAIKGRGQGHWDAVTAHNPKIKKFGNTYYLYYISTRGNLTKQELIDTARGGYRHKNWGPLRNAQRVGVAISTSINGPWKRPGKALLEPKAPAHTITVNPAVTATADGKSYIMMFKGDKKPVRSKRVQAIATGPTPAGPFAIQPKLAIADFDTEDASIWYDSTRKRYYAVFHAHKVFGLITSADGLNWKKATHFEFAKAFPSAQGGVFRAGRLERPNVLTNAEGVPEVFIASYRKGNDTGIFTIPLKQ